MKSRYAFVLTPTWLGWLALCAVFAVSCYFLGEWQLDRRELAVEENSRVVENYDEPPVPYSDVREMFHSPAANDEWTVTRLHGEYLEEDFMLVRNRGHGGQVGYEQLVPFRDAATGEAVIVSRGWLPTASEDGSRPAYNPEPPQGDVEVTVRLKPAEADISRGAPEGQLASISLDEYQQQVDYPVVSGAYGLMAEESPEPAEQPSQLQRPELDEGPHLSYSMQWLTFGLMSFVGWGYAARIHARNRDMEELADGAPMEAGTSQVARQERIREAKRLRRKRKGRYSDEDAEDAWVEDRLRRE